MSWTSGSPDHPAHGAVRAEDDFGQINENVVPAELDELVEYVTTTGGYLVVETPETKEGQFIQVVLEGAPGDDRWLVEVRNGATPPLHSATVNTIELAKEALRAWAFGVTGLARGAALEVRRLALLRARSPSARLFCFPCAATASAAVASREKR